jgi:23S rRNA pseudouridine2605 synthase
MEDKAEKGERIAKRLARAGICSRREAERMIGEGRITLNGKVLETPAVVVTDDDKIAVDGVAVAGKEPTRLWLYHKPRGLVTSHSDEKGRDTVFDHLPEGMPRVISVGRLDLNSEGLLLLTNDGELSRHMELPATAWERKYRVRALGHISQEKLDRLQKGIKLEGIAYGPIDARLEEAASANIWIAMTLTEGKNREIRKVLDHLGLQVNRLIRVSYGPFELGNLQPEGVKEVSRKDLKRIFGDKIS